MMKNNVLLTDNLSFDMLEKRINMPEYAGVWAAMNKKWREAASADAASDKIRYMPRCGSAAVTPGLIDAALAWKLTDDEQALAYVRAQVDKLDRIYGNPPHSFKEFTGGRTTYFSNVEMCLSAEVCGVAMGEERLEIVRRLAREYWINDHDKSDNLLVHGAGHNIPFTRLISAARCALIMGEECGHADWRKVVELASDACHLFGRWGFDDNGVSYEASTYGFAVATHLYQYAELLRARGGEDLYKTLPLLRKLPDAMAMLVFPARDGVPSYSDSHSYVCHDPMNWLLLTAKRFNQPRHLAFWHELGGPMHESWATLLWWDGRKQEKDLESFALPLAFHTRGAALASMRTSWGREAVYVNLVGQGRSHSAPGHNHADAGHFSIQAFGEHLAIDPGYWNYNEDQHSVVLIDGKGNIVCDEGWYGMQPLAGRMDLCKHYGFLDYALVEADAAKGCIWADRHFLFVRIADDDAYLVVIDNINPDNAAHHFLWQLQARPGCSLDIISSNRAAIHGEQARLDCVFLAPLPDDYPSHPHSLTLRHDVKTGAEPKNSRTTRPRLLADLEGLNGQLMSIIIPRRAGTPELSVKEKISRRVFRAEIDCGLYVDTVTSALDHGYLPDDQGSVFTELEFIRRSPEGEILSRWTIEGGMEE